MNKKPNKIFIVVIIALAVSLVNYLSYPFIIDRQFQMVDVPVANTDITSYSQIEESMIDYVKMPKNYLSQGILQDYRDIVGHFVSYNTMVQKGSFFYKGAVLSKEDLLLDNAYLLDEGSYLFSLKLDEITSTNHSLAAGQFVDLYFYAKENRDQYKLVNGLLFEHVPVYQVIDSNEYYVILGLNEKQLDYCMRAYQIGTIHPIVSYNSINKQFVSDEYYSPERLMAYIDENSLSFKKVNINVPVE